MSTDLLASIGEAFLAFIKKTAIIVGIIAAGFVLIGLATGVHDIITNPQPPVPAVSEP